MVLLIWFEALTILLVASACGAKPNSTDDVLGSAAPPPIASAAVDAGASTAAPAPAQAAAPVAIPPAVPAAAQPPASPRARPDASPEDSRKDAPGVCGYGIADDDVDDDGVADCKQPQTPAACKGPVLPVPKAVRDRLRLDAFYQKYVDAGGIPIVSSAAPDDRALLLGCELVLDLLSDREDVRDEMIQNGARLAIIGRNEGTADLPEYGYVGRPQRERDQINARARGLAGVVASCGEENILCLEGDRYHDESICLHELSHTVSMYGLFGVDPSFENRLNAAYRNAQTTNLFADTYSLESEQEYWAEGAQDWYDTNAESDPSNGIHNEINTRDELRDYDPMLYALLEELFPDAPPRWPDCHRRMPGR